MVEGSSSLKPRQGLQYTRNGHFNMTTDGTLVTADGFVVQGETGTDEYGPLVLPGGQVGVDPPWNRPDRWAPQWKI